MSDENEEWICGLSYDHRLSVVAEREGWTTYECLECGAEILEEPDEDDA